MDPDLAKGITERARNDYYQSGMLTLFGFVVSEISRDLPIDRREHILRRWKQVHLQKLNEDVARVQQDPSTFSFVEKVLFGTNDLDGESVRVLGRQLINEMEPGIRALLGLKDPK